MDADTRIARELARESEERETKRDRYVTTFCHHNKSMVEQCTACEDEEDNR